MDPSPEGFLIWVDGPVSNQQVEGLVERLRSQVIDALLPERLQAAESLAKGSAGTNGL